MQIGLGPPLALNEAGQQKGQEDSVCPDVGMATPDSRFFVVCDGMGGHENGRAASRAVCDGLYSHLKEKDLSRFDNSLFEEALCSAYAQLDAAESECGGQNSGLGSRPKMGTTLAFACFHSGGLFVAHIGDSRVYHIRGRNHLSLLGRRGPAEILHRTVDHSHVSELMRAGLITEEEAKTHPKKNVITRAMQPGGEKRAKADVCNISDIRRGDYVFLCTDGIRESVDDAMLCSILGAKGPDEAKMRAIKSECEKNSKDNYSAYLVPIEAVKKDRGNRTWDVAMLRAFGRKGDREK